MAKIQRVALGILKYLTLPSKIFDLLLPTLLPTLHLELGLYSLMPYHKLLLKVLSFSKVISCMRWDEAKSDFLVSC